MKAEDYVDKFLEQVKEIKTEEELKEVYVAVFQEFSNEVTELINQRKAKRDEAVISIIKEVGKKYDKFCRLMDEQQDIASFIEGGFYKKWDSKLNLTLKEKLMKDRNFRNPYRV